ncbi:hypothetical protein HXX76_009141 [Chlamydomonas incerta]|uniref:NmrA-like domain-containing protein n=1 Tax=Chlamydomonas incerta TaxID=51695 RepID=A0A835VWS2_CHLIN|nr:hypothetical protein HXX76_009141 [Chlamydomonas incerta]|eukprot:KAG2432222.1 hypothetical protein HXX76_009141 [Chlamydomonas incerta]
MLQQRPAAPNSRVHGSSATPTVTRRLAGTCAAFQQQQRPSATPTTPTALAALAAACAPSLAGAWRSGRGASATARPATSHSAAASAFAPATATKAPAGAVAATSSLSGLVALRRGAMSRHSAAAAAGAGSSGGSSSGGDGSSSSAFVEVPADGRVVLVGITGATGRSALQGLLTAAGPGRTGHQLWAMTRNPSGASAQGLPAGVQALAGDLDAPASLGPALRGASAVYCHALSKDGATADPQELVRARSLAAAAAAAGVKLIMYNSSGGRGCGYGITQMEQKHQVEDILAAAVPTVALQGPAG